MTSEERIRAIDRAQNVKELRSLGIAGNAYDDAPMFAAVERLLLKPGITVKEQRELFRFLHVDVMGLTKYVDMTNEEVRAQVAGIREEKKTVAVRKSYVKPQP
jgi:hypothetical protein